MPELLPWGLVLVSLACAIAFARLASARRVRLDGALREREQLAAERSRHEVQLTEQTAAMRTQSDLLAVVCREVRSHLDGIIGSAELVLDTKLQPAQRAQLVTLKTTGESLLYLLNDLQAVSQAEYRTLAGGRAPFDLREEMAQVIEVVAPRAMLKGVEIVLLFQPDVPRRLSGDDTLLRQFIFNLIVSALKAAGPGALVVSVARGTAAHRRAAPNEVFLRFAATVAPPAELAAEPGKSSRSPFAVLDNLPLTIARRLAELAGGEYGEAAPDAGGPSYWFDVPFEPVGTPTARVDAIRGCLVIWDDEPASRVALADLAAESGLECDLALSAADAIEALTNGLEDHDDDVMLLLDESVPEEWRRELAEAFSNRPLLQPVKVILLSLRPEKATLPAGLPVCAVLPKPVLRGRDLLQAVESARHTEALAPVTEHSFSQPPYPATTASGPLVLLAEDDEVSSQVNATVLKRLGCRVDLAGDGLTAVTLTKRRQYGLILMDCHMPRLDGFKAAVRIRTMLGAKTPPIVALTAENSPEIRARATESGMDAFMLKPANRVDFQRVLEKFVPPTGAAGAAGSERHS